jgi:hypothetical protein
MYRGSAQICTQFHACHDLHFFLITSPTITLTEVTSLNIGSLRHSSSFCICHRLTHVVVKVAQFYINHDIYVE